MKAIFLIFLTTFTLHAQGMGNLFFEGNCITCHQIEKAISAPSVKEVTQVYREKYPQKQQFIDKMHSWVQDPKAQTALMHEAIAKYELMPKIAYDTYTLKEIAAFMYDNF
ncbi:MAG: c-type cytochrome [Campylobacterota bacterium]